VQINRTGFSHRLKDLFIQEKYSLEDIELLKIGRHFRLDKNTKIVVGRNKDENSQMERYFHNGDILFEGERS